MASFPYSRMIRACGLCGSSRRPNGQPRCSDRESSGRCRPPSWLRGGSPIMPWTSSNWIVGMELVKCGTSATRSLPCSWLFALKASRLLIQMVDCRGERRRRRRTGRGGRRCGRHDAQLEAFDGAAVELHDQLQVVIPVVVRIERHPRRRPVHDRHAMHVLRAAGGAHTLRQSRAEHRRQQAEGDGRAGPLQYVATAMDFWIIGHGAAPFLI